MAAPLSWVISKARIWPMHIEIGSPVRQTGLKSATKHRMALKSWPSWPCLLSKSCFWVLSAGKKSCLGLLKAPHPHPLRSKEFKAWGQKSEEILGLGEWFSLFPSLLACLLPSTPSPYPHLFPFLGGNPAPCISMQVSSQWATRQPLTPHQFNFSFLTHSRLGGRCGQRPYWVFVSLLSSQFKRLDQNPVIS